MRLSDTWKISIRGIRGKWAALVALGMAVSAFCLCCAGAVFVSVRREKSAPFALIVSSESGTEITGATLADILEVTDVEDATPVLQIPVQITMGEYRAELTLTGIRPSYLEDQSGLPEESIMPYIVLNEAACKMFSTKTTSRKSDSAPEIDWFNTKAIISIGGESAPITSKVCGILESQSDDAPAAYISLGAARSLLKASGQPLVSETAYVRIRNIGCAASVSRELGALRLTAGNADMELQARWDAQTKEMSYLIALGALGLIFLTAFLSAWRRLSLYEQQNSYAMLHWIGMRKKEIARIFSFQMALLTLIGIGVGILIALLLPSFLSQELMGGVDFYAAHAGSCCSDQHGCVYAGERAFLVRQTGIT